LSGDALVWSRYAFYFWLSAFNMFVVSGFWAFMADVFRLEQSRRLFGFIGVGGTLGALVGAKFTELFAASVNTYVLMLASVLLLEISARLVRVIGRNVADRVPETVGSTPAFVAAWDGLRLVLTSPYMRVIGIYILLQTLVAAALNLQVNQLISDARSSAAERTTTFANRDVYTQLATLALQLFVTGRLIAWLGVKRTLVIQPFLTFGGFALLAWVLPSSPEPGGGFPADLATLEFALWTVIGFDAVFRASQNGFARPARETLFTVVTRDEKYKAKSFLDTPVLRGGDVLFAFTFQTGLKEALKLPGALICALVVPFAGVWIFVAWLCGHVQQRIAGERKS
jgi:AAA family ATP:ADP antiporter